MIKKYSHNKHFLIVVVIIFCVTQLHGFIDIEEAARYAQQHDEYPMPDNQDLSMPNYASFYRSQIPGFFSSIAQKIGLKEKSLWTIEKFKKILDDVIAQREKNGYKGRFVEKIEPTAESNIIIFGDVFGAFHSLVRDVQELVRIGILNNEFKIINDDNYIVFNGNVIDLSPYILETLTLVLDLMNANPERVFYLKGQHEDNDYWHTFGLKQELELRATHVSNEKIPLGSLIDQFFNTLPLALYIVGMQEGVKELVRISPQNRKSSELNEQEFGNFFYETNKPDIRLVTHKGEATKVPIIEAIVKTRENLSAYPPSNGLISIDKDQGSFAWAVFSSPTLINRSLYGFFYDAFTIIHVTEQFNDWTISLYNRDVREAKGFAKEGEFKLLTGKKVEEKESLAQEEQKSQNEQKKEQQSEQTIISQQEQRNEAIILGTSLDLSKGLRVESQLSLVGFNIAIDRANRTGGVHGRKIKLIALDDEYNPKKGRENIEIFRKNYNISIILSPIGETSLEGYIDLVKEEKLLVVFPISGAISLRDPNVRYMIHFRPSYDAIYTALLKYAREQLGAKKFAIAYETDLSSEGIDEQIKNAGIAQENYVGVPYDPTITSFEKQADAIKKFNPDAIVFLGLSRNTEQIIDAMGIEHVLGKKLLGDELGDAAFIKFLNDRGLSHTFIDAENIPNPKTSNLEILREYRQDIGDPSKIEPCSAETYVSTSIFIDALRRIKGPITNESIIEIFENTKNYYFKGFELNFNPATRELSQDIWFNVGTPEWVKIVVKPNASKIQEEVKKSEEPTVANHEHEIVIGATLDLSKALSIQGADIYFGMKKAFEKANREGGINDKKIRLIALDDEGNPSLARQNVEKLINNYGTSFIISPLQATSIKGYLDLIRNGDVLALFPCTGSTVLEDPTLKNLITIRAWYTDTDILALLYPRKKWGVKRTAFFASNDELNADLEKHLESTKVPKEDYKIFFHDPAVLDFSTIKKDILAYAPDLIVLYSSIQASLELLRQIGPEHLLGMRLLGEEFNSALFREFINAKGLKNQYFDVENLPNPQASQVPIVIEYRNEIGTSKINSFTLEGYVNASLFIELARLTKGPITKESLLQTAQSLNNYDFKGLKLTYNNRQLFNKIWLDEGAPEWAPVDVAELIKSQ